MKTQTVIIELTGVIVVAYFIWRKFINQKIEPDTDTTRPSDEYLPKQEKENDKLVIIDNVTDTEIDSILTGFCNMYNNKSFKALPRLYKLNGGRCAITFPYDIDFEIYCYFINYLQYPMEFEKSFNVIAWTTAKSGQTWVTDKTANKQVMLFIPSDDTEYDNVYLTTSDNIGYKLGFAIGKEKRLLESPMQFFTAPEIDFASLANKAFKDYK